MGAVVPAIVGTAASLYSSNRARQEQKAARRLEQKRAQLQSRRQALETVRAAQIQRAGVAAQGEMAGLGGSSALAGSLGSIQSQAGASLGFAQNQFQLKSQAESRLQSAANWGFRGQLWNTVSSLAGAATTPDDWKKLFGSSSPQSTGATTAGVV